MSNFSLRLKSGVVGVSIAFTATCPFWANAADAVSTQTHVREIGPKQEGQVNEICPGLNSTSLQLAVERIAKYDSAYKDSISRPVFFIGAISRIDDRERRQLSTALSRKPEAEMVKAVTEVLNTLNSRLSADRREIAAWVSARNLSQEIEVQSIPVEGSFLLIKATKNGIRLLVCASAEGTLPSLLTNLSF